MADDAHALSPLNARAASPGDADYEAILNAFLETSRGRWFLGEYARRNRNADTHMVLSAVERIEAAFAGQKTLPASPQNALPAIIDAVAVTKSAVDQMAAQPASREPLDLIQRGARAIRDISWTLRECGADGRICDLIDVQIKAINEGCERVEATSADSAGPERISSAFSDLTQTIEMLVTGAPAPSQVPLPLAAIEPALATGVAIENDVVELDDVAYEAMVDATSLAILGDAEDAARPAAADTDDLLDDLEVIDAAIPIDAMHAPHAADRLAQSAPPEAVASLAPQAAVTGNSLGHALLASGLVGSPAAMPNDPLAPFRRMSQADKIAFFT